MEIASIVLASVALVGSIITPIIVATATFINRIKESDCCGGHIELETNKKDEKDEKYKNEQELPKTESILNKINNLLKK